MAPGTVFLKRGIFAFLLHEAKRSLCKWGGSYKVTVWVLKMLTQWRTVGRLCTHILWHHIQKLSLCSQKMSAYFGHFCSNCKRARMTHLNSFQHTVSITQQAVSRGFHSSFGGTTPGIKIVTWRSYVFIVLYCTVYHGIAQCQLAGTVWLCWTETARQRWIGLNCKERKVRNRVSKGLSYYPGLRSSTSSNCEHSSCCRSIRSRKLWSSICLLILYTTGWHRTNACISPCLANWCGISSYSLF